ncbi:hypothetical protein [Thermoflavimicrobium dichotomicum]|uniref:Uncharacterized protein n=1 Tax=Thermoflavimicrobium dichotomicum TaxID=46223 RepID=A0A1I3PQE0_9BACL|nr:hypothetical protein [Thermoflavimicrobium dichotomicum]SFJ24014.1 hypothetical protein SAMN05421852_10684 [Thermoflavimicrobium dichotomicum]
MESSSYRYFHESSAMTESPHAKRRTGSMNEIYESSSSNKARLHQLGVRLQLFQDVNFSGRRIVFENRGVAVSDIRAFDFNDRLSSFRMFNANNPSQLTLVLWQHVGYQGARRVFYGQRAVSSLPSPFNDQMSSFVFVPAVLSLAQINQIQSTRNTAGLRIVEISQ